MIPSTFSGWEVVAALIKFAMWDEGSWSAALIPHPPSIPSGSSLGFPTWPSPFDKLLPPLLFGKMFKLLSEWPTRRAILIGTAC